MNSYSEQIHIEEILLEANAFGVRNEVDLWAKALITENPKMSKVDAYQKSYNRWDK